MRNIGAIVWCILISLHTLQGQVVKTNEKGEKIIEYPDGTWKPFVESGTEDPLGVKPAADNPWLELDPEEEARKKAIRYAELLSAVAAQLENYALESRTTRQALELEYEDMKTHPGDYPIKEVEEMQRMLSVQSEREDLAFELYQHAIRLAQNAENLIFLKPKKRDKAIKKLEAEKAELDEKMALLNQTEDPGSTESPVVEKNYKAYDPLKDPRVNPPPFPCMFTHNEIDKFTGRLRRDLQPVLLFTHTPKDLRPFLRDREYITCKGYLADLSDGLLFMSLEFSIASNNAQASFGGIPSGSILSILMMNGETIRLINSKSDAGYFDAAQGAYIYRSQFQISGLQEKFLQTGEMDQFRVIWATGYEDYEVFELDFFRNQINCLRNVN